MGTAFGFELARTAGAPKTPARDTQTQLSWPRRTTALPSGIAISRGCFWESALPRLSPRSARLSRLQVRAYGGPDRRCRRSRAVLSDERSAETPAVVGARRSQRGRVCAQYSKRAAKARRALGMVAAQRVTFAAPTRAAYRKTGDRFGHHPAAAVGGRSSMAFQAGGVERLAVFARCRETGPLESGLLDQDCGEPLSYFADDDGDGFGRGEFRFHLACTRPRGPPRTVIPTTATARFFLVRRATSAALTRIPPAIRSTTTVPAAIPDPAGAERAPDCAARSVCRRLSRLRFRGHRANGQRRQSNLRQSAARRVRRGAASVAV